jgi:hypothetical protein
MFMMEVIGAMEVRRKRYSLQLMKLIYMFPDDEYS